MPEVVFTGQSGNKWKYRTDQILGKGGFGAVYAGEGSDGTPMAVKVVDKQRHSRTLDERLLRREIDIGRRVHDSGGDMLLPLIDAAKTSAALLLVMPRPGDPMGSALPMTQDAAIGAKRDRAAAVQARREHLSRPETPERAPARRAVEASGLRDRS